MESSEDFSNHVQLLGDALRRVLVFDGVIREDAAPSGPELLAITEDYIAKGRDQYAH